MKQSKKLDGRSAGRRFPDDYENQLFKVWHKHRQQARFRNEDYDLTPEDFIALWPKKLWAKRGRSRNSLCLVRVDLALPWSKQNCAVISRLEQLRTTNKRRKETGPYMKYQLRSQWT